MIHLRAIFVILFVLLVIIVAVPNYPEFSKTVRFRLDLKFLEYETSEMSLYFVAVITFLVGVISSGVYGIVERFRLKTQIRSLTKEAGEKDEELNSLRNLPVIAEDMGSDQPNDQQ